MRRHRVLPIAIVIAMLFGIAGSMPGIPAAASQASGGGITITVETVGAIDTATLESTLRPSIDTALSELTALFPQTGSPVLAISFGAAPEATTQKRSQAVGTTAWIDPAAGQAVVSLDAFATLSPLEAGNVIRNLVARKVLFDLTGGALPAGLNDGFAYYFERPVLAEQARRGSLVQQLDLAQELPELVTIVNDAPSLVAGDSLTSVHYAFVAFLADHYGVSSLQQLVTLSGSSISWRPIVESATGQTVDQIATAWEQFLPRWFSGGWQVNVFDGFDLSMAQGLFDRGAYAAAISVAEQSLELFTQIGDPVRLGETEEFITMSSIGVRAEQLMKDTQLSLEQHDYVQAESKINEAEAQYAYLPESHRPASLIDSWRGMIRAGLAADDDLATAKGLADDWSKSRESRNFAIAAGNAYASLGDVDRAVESQELATSLNLRLQRITLAAIGVVVLIAMWLLVWLWARAPHRFMWTDPRHLRANAGRSA
jgi:tetratricopeptide (TPR) repeat protein